MKVTGVVLIRVTLPILDLLLVWLLPAQDHKCVLHKFLLKLKLGCKLKLKLRCKFKLKLMLKLRINRYEIIEEHGNCTLKYEVHLV